jgi:hypothetical protein
MSTLDARVTSEHMRTVVVTYCLCFNLFAVVSMNEFSPTVTYFDLIGGGGVVRGAD